MNKKQIIFILIILASIISIILYTKGISEYDNLLNEDIFTNQTTTENKIEETESISEIPKIKVHIVGEIHSPGLYELEEGSRIHDLILLSGGATEKADLSKVNLAYELSDGEKIYIPSIFNEVSTYIYNDAGENVSEQSDNASSKSGKININKATVSDLENVSGIGPSLASKIINYRNSIGKFNSIDELKNVSGIGDKKFETIKEFVTIK